MATLGARRLGMRAQKARKLEDLTRLLESEPDLYNREYAERLGVTEWTVLQWRKQLKARAKGPLAAAELVAKVLELGAGLEAEQLVAEQLRHHAAAEGRRLAVLLRDSAGEMVLDAERLARALTLGPGAHARAARNMTLEHVVALLLDDGP